MLSKAPSFAEIVLTKQKETGPYPVVSIYALMDDAWPPTHTGRGRVAECYVTWALGYCDERESLRSVSHHASARIWVSAVSDQINVPTIHDIIGDRVH